MEEIINKIKQLKEEQCEMLRNFRQQNDMSNQEKFKEHEALCQKYREKLKELAKPITDNSFYKIGQHVLFLDTRFYLEKYKEEGFLEVIQYNVPPDNINITTYFENIIRKGTISEVYFDYEKKRVCYRAKDVIPPLNYYDSLSKSIIGFTHLDIITNLGIYENKF